MGTRIGGGGVGEGVSGSMVHRSMTFDPHPEGHWTKALAPGALVGTN